MEFCLATSSNNFSFAFGGYLGLYLVGLEISVLVLKGGYTKGMLSVFWDVHNS